MKHRKTLIWILVATVCLAVVALAGCSCKGCGKNKNHEHDFGELVGGVEKTCETEGRLSYYECKICKEKYDVTKTVKLTDIVIKKGHDVASTKEYVAATCLSGGNYAYSYCSACNKYLDDDGNEITTPVIPALGHDFTNGHYEYVDATCTTDGHYEYYKCGRCDKYYSDNDEYTSAETTPEQEIMPKTNHPNKTFEQRVDTDCRFGENGVKEHFHCNVCNKDVDMQGNVVSEEELIIPVTHELSYVKRTDSTCETDGVKAHYHCSACDRDYTDADGKTLCDDTTISKTGHSFFDENGNPDVAKLIARKEATATENGYVSHYACEKCGKNFDESGAELDNVLLLFGHTLVYKKGSSMDCKTRTEGLTEHYECSDEGCGMYFDMNGKAVSLNSLSVPYAHTFGDLIEINDGDCKNKAVKKAHYKCEVCGILEDENGNTLKEADAYGNLGEHVYETGTYHDEYYHTSFCSLCGYYGGYFMHDGKVTYYKDSRGKAMKKTECSACGYTDEKEYFSADGVVASPICVGTTEMNYYSVNLTRENGTENMWISFDYVVSDKTSEEVAEFMKTFASDNSLKIAYKDVEVFYEDFKGTVRLCFYKNGYEFDKVYSFYKKLDVNTTDSLTDISYVTYTVGGKKDVYSYEITISEEDEARFTALKEQLATDGGESAFTYSVVYDGKTFSVTVTFCAETPVYLVGFATEENVIAGERPKITFLWYSDDSTREVEADLYCDEYYFIDYTTPGVYYGVCIYQGVYAEKEVTVHSPDDVKKLVLSSNNINLGEELYLVAEYYGGYKKVVVVTADMIESGRLDTTRAGEYDNVTIVYEGVECNVWRISISDNKDNTPSGISMDGDDILWKTDDDGNVVADTTGLRLRVSSVNDNYYYTDVTSSMLSYDEDEAKLAVENGEGFDVTVTYLGLTCIFTVRAFKEGETEARYVSADLYFTDKTFGEKYLEVTTTNYEKYYVKLTADMIYNAVEEEDGYVKTTPFDLASAEKGIYDVIICYDGKEFDETAYVYSTSDVKTMFTCGVSEYYPVGSKESVLKSIRETIFSYYVSYVRFGDEMETFDDDETDVATINFIVPEGTDFSKPGKIKLVATYKNAATTIETELIANLTGGKEYFCLDGRDVLKATFFNEGYVLVNGRYDKYFKDDVNGIYGFNGDLSLFQDYTFYKKTVTGNLIERFKASDLATVPDKTLVLEDGSETYEYRFYDVNGKIYVDKLRKNGSVYNYTATLYAEFSSDGQMVVLNGEDTYSVKDDAMSCVMPGNTVYTYIILDDSGKENSRLCFNDNGKVYSAEVTVNADGTETTTVSTGCMDWVKDGNVVKIVFSNIELMTFDIVKVDGKETLVLSFGLLE